MRLIPRDKYLEHLSTNIESVYRQHIRTKILLLSTLSRIHALEQPKASDKIALTLLYMAS